MIQPWADIVATIAEFRPEAAEQPFKDALRGVESVALAIANGPLGGQLFGWTSMHDLCIQQTLAAPYTGPFLRIAPLHSGMVEFRYHDTMLAERQWHREVLPKASVRMLELFLEQLHWIVRG